MSYLMWSSQGIKGYKTVLKCLWNPDLMNYAWLGNHIHLHNGHGHLHIIPRYKRLVLLGRRKFLDKRWGKNYAPRPKLELPRKTLFLIRDKLRK